MTHLWQRSNGSVQQPLIKPAHFPLVFVWPPLGVITLQALWNSLIILRLFAELLSMMRHPHQHMLSSLLH